MVHHHAGLSPVVFRARGLAVFSWAAVVGFAVFMAVTSPGAHHRWPHNHQILAVALVTGLFMYFAWLMGGHSAVRMDAGGLTIDNLLVRHFVPWDALRTIDIDQRRGIIFAAHDGTWLGSVMYASSLAGALTHYRLQRNDLVRMRAAAEQLAGPADSAPPSTSHSTRVVFSPWPLLAFVGLAEALAGWPFLF